VPPLLEALREASDAAGDQKPDTGKRATQASRDSIVRRVTDAEGHTRDITVATFGLMGSPMQSARPVAGHLAALPEAADALVAITLSTDAAPLRAALASPDPEYRAVAAEVMALVAGKRWQLLMGQAIPAAPEALDKGAADDSPGKAGVLARMRSAGSRVRMGDLAAISTLMEGLDSPDIEVQVQAVEGLSKSAPSSEEAVAALKETLSTARSETLRLKAAGELAGLEDPEAIEEVRKFVESDDPVEKLYAEQSLGGGGDQSLDMLTVGLEDPSPLVRVNAAVAILRTLNAEAQRQAPRGGMLVGPDAAR
jgi:HEAT repeat protein